MSAHPATTAAEPRRRLSWGRRPAAARTRPAASPRVPRRPFDYAPAARPEQQAALATLVPTRFPMLALAVASIVLAVAGTLALGAVPGALDALAGWAGPRFARSIAALREAFDPRTALVAGWLAEMFLLVAAALSLSVRGMRRHRRDGRHGRARAWLLLALLLAAGAAAGRWPLGRIVAAILTDATGIVLGPAGAGWWVAVAAAGLLVAVCWTTLPLHGRLGPAAWWTLALGCLGAAAAMPWIDAGALPGADRIETAVVGPGAWLCGAAAGLIAVLVAARGVIREVRGEIAAPPATAPAAAPAKGHAPPQAHVRAAAADHAAERVTGPVFEPVEEDDEPATDADATRYTDGTDADGGDLEEEYASRPLSKAEKKRLRKLARSGTAA